MTSLVNLIYFANIIPRKTYTGIEIPL